MKIMVSKGSEKVSNVILPHMKHSWLLIAARKGSYNFSNSILIAVHSRDPITGFLVYVEHGTGVISD